MRTSGMVPSINLTNLISHSSTTTNSLRCQKLKTPSSYTHLFGNYSSSTPCARLLVCNNFSSCPSSSLRTRINLSTKKKKETTTITKTKTNRPTLLTPRASSGDVPLVGNVAPDFELEAVLDQEFIKVKLSDYIGKSFVILFFYPLDFTFVCPTEITAFSDRYSEFQDLNTTIIGISTDSIFSHLAWLQTDRKSGGLGDLRYPLASDLTKSISKQYNVLIRDQGVALRGLFIIDMDGIIQYSTTNNLSFGRSVDETLRILQAIQYVQNNPEHVCPVEWKPGEKSIPSSPQLSKDYFAN